VVGNEMGAVLNYLSLNSHFESFAKGLLTSSDLLYYFSVIGGLLFLTTRSLETRRWR
jgi:ABC-2 type transport system permease protein